MRPTAGSSAVGMRLLLACHIGALLVTGRVGAVGAALRPEESSIRSSGIRPRPGSLRGEGQRITGTTTFEEGRRRETDVGGRLKR